MAACQTPGSMGGSSFKDVRAFPDELGKFAEVSKRFWMFDVMPGRSPEEPARCATYGQKAWFDVIKGRSPK